MKRFQKSLCFVMALVFVLGLCTVGAGAAFTDAAEINYDDAVTVMNGLGILTGYEDGSFKPGNNVTRAEAAAMITRMMLGPENADKLPLGDVKFSDVPENNWAAKYISFCANKGIIVGMGDGTFHPGADVTGTQLATMLLRSVGYGTMGEYEGKGWDINAVADALYYKIFEDTTVRDFDRAASREECALYVFNTLTKVDLVKWDVDVNRYLYHNDPFGESVFDLMTPDTGIVREVQSTNGKITYVTEEIGYPTIIGNKATGEAYTVAAFWTIAPVTAPKKGADGKDVVDADGKVVYEVVGYETVIDEDRIWYLDYETGLDLIGHEVALYFNEKTIKDKVNHVDVHETYLIDDVSEELVMGTYYNDFYRNAVNANRKNADVVFTSIPTWTDSDYARAGYLGGVWDWDYEQWYNHQYKTVAELKGQRSSGDKTYMIGLDFTPGAPRLSKIILDHEGNIMLALTSDWHVGQVKAIDEYGFDIKLADGSTPNYDRKDINEVYDGIKKGDYVVIQDQGALYNILPTTTKTVEVSELDASRGTINKVFYQDSYGYGINVPDYSDYEDVRVGDTVKFYVSFDFGFMTYYFALSIEDAAELDGVVFLNYVKKTTGDDEWGKSVDTYKAQAVTEAGEIVTYKINESTFNELKAVGSSVGTDEYLIQDVYKAYKKSSGYTIFKDYSEEKDTQGNPKYIGEFTKTEGRNSFLKRDGGTYYVTGDTKVCYLTKKTDSIYKAYKGPYGSALNVTTAKKLKNTGSDYTVYASYRTNGGSYNLRTVWVVGYSAPEDYEDSYVFIYEDNADPTGYRGFGSKNTDTPYYTLLIDGEEVEAFIKTKDANLSGPKAETLAQGFYKFNINDAGQYELTKVAANKVQTDDLIKGGFKNSKLYAEFADGVTVKNLIYDVSGDTTIKTQQDVNVLSAERLEELLDDGYEVTLTYIFKTSSGNRVPVGTIYVTEVVRPDAAENP